MKTLNSLNFDFSENQPVKQIPIIKIENESESVESQQNVKTLKKFDGSGDFVSKNLITTPVKNVNKTAEVSKISHKIDAISSVAGGDQVSLPASDVNNNLGILKTPAKVSKTFCLKLGTPSKSKVTFGRDLSPQLFDKFDPANTPLKLGERQSSNNTKSLTDIRPFRLMKNLQPTNFGTPKLTARPHLLSTPKQIRFNRDLSPEIFDTNLPSNTPLKRGETPKEIISKKRPSKLQGKCLFKSASHCTPKIQGMKF